MSDKRTIPAPAFTPEQIEHGLKRAGGRCELHTLSGDRCKEQATNPVLFLMWVNGGEPPMDNFVAACPIHAAQYRKGLSFLRSIRVVRNRRNYFPYGENTAPEVIASAILDTLPV